MDRRRAIWMAAVVLLAAAYPAQAHNVRTEDGLVIVPVPAIPTALATEVARCAYTAVPDPGADGMFGKVIELLPNEGDGDHRFILRDGQMGLTPPPSNFDIEFFDDLGSCDPASPRLPIRGPSFAGPGDESGLVPQGARYAVVVTTDSVMVSFLLTIYS